MHRLTSEYHSALALRHHPGLCVIFVAPPCLIFLINDPSHTFNQTPRRANTHSLTHWHDSHHVLTSLGHTTLSRLALVTDGAEGSARRRVCHMCDRFAICFKRLTISRGVSGMAAIEKCTRGFRRCTQM